MVNIEEFIKRLETILDYYSLTASSFADKISVQRSSMLHLLSGRNKPSLDFILKLVEEFPEVTFEWILNGNGSFPKEDFVAPTLSKIESEKITETQKENDLFSTSVEIKKEENEEKNKSFSKFVLPNENQIEQIVIFFKDGSFKNYHP